MKGMSINFAPRVGGNRGLDGEKERDACGEADKHTNGKIGINKLG